MVLFKVKQVKLDVLNVLLVLMLPYLDKLNVLYVQLVVHRIELESNNVNNVHQGLIQFQLDC